MISVVVPTMWRYSPFLDFVTYIVKNEVVKEVIIINNDKINTPSHHILSDPKIKLVNLDKNILVNPAWNLGIDISSEDKVCILNDDIIFDLKLFYKVDEFLNEQMGCIGLNAGNIEMGQTPVTNGEIFFELFTGQRCFGFGNLMFIHKAVWKPIPQGLNLWFGDNYIFDYYYFRGHQNYFISNMFHYHQASSTINTVHSELDDRMVMWSQEGALYEQIKQKLSSKEYYN